MKKRRKRHESVFNYEQGKVGVYDYNGLGSRIARRTDYTRNKSFNDIIFLTQTHQEDVLDLTLH